MKALIVSVAMMIVTAPVLAAGQIHAGSAEDKMFQAISAEKNPETKLQRLTEYEKQFPNSRALASIYLIAIDLYRDKSDRAKMIEYGEKVLKVDDQNITAMMVLSRNYAIGRENLDRAVELAEKAVNLLTGMKDKPAPSSYTEAQWKTYLESTEAAARNIMEYTKGIRDRNALNAATQH